MPAATVYVKFNVLESDPDTYAALVVTGAPVPREIVGAPVTVTASLNPTWIDTVAPTAFGELSVDVVMEVTTGTVSSIEKPALVMTVPAATVVATVVTVPVTGWDTLTE